MMGEFSGPLILRVGSQVAPGLAPWLGERVVTVLAPSHFLRMLHKSLRQRLKSDVSQRLVSSVIPESLQIIGIHGTHHSLCARSTNKLQSPWGSDDRRLICEPW